MTIVAYKDGVMAADTAFWCGPVIEGHATKIRRLKNGALVGCSGDGTIYQWFFDWIENHGAKSDREKPDAGGFGALVVTPDGEVIRYGENCLPITLTGPFFAMGAGATFAMGAMAAGASAEEAVRLTIENTDTAAGNIQVERLDMT